MPAVPAPGPRGRLREAGAAPGPRPPGPRPCGRGLRACFAWRPPYWPVRSTRLGAGSAPLCPRLPGDATGHAPPLRRPRPSPRPLLQAARRWEQDRALPIGRRRAARRDWPAAAAAGGADGADWRGPRGCARGAAARSGRWGRGRGWGRPAARAAERRGASWASPSRPAVAAVPATMNRLGSGPVGSAAAAAAAAAGQYRVCGNCRKVPRQVSGGARTDAAGDAGEVCGGIRVARGSGTDLAGGTHTAAVARGEVGNRAAVGRGNGGGSGMEASQEERAGECEVGAAGRGEPGGRRGVPSAAPPSPPSPPSPSGRLSLAQACPRLPPCIPRVWGALGIAGLDMGPHCARKVYYPRIPGAKFTPAISVKSLCGGGIWDQSFKDVRKAAGMRSPPAPRAHPRSSPGRFPRIPRGCGGCTPGADICLSGGISGGAFCLSSANELKLLSCSNAPSLRAPKMNAMPVLVLF